jgi:hypothetical protein
MPKSEGPCHNVLIADGRIARVERCRDCRAVSVHLGVLTFRVDIEALVSLSATLAEAVRALGVTPVPIVGKPIHRPRGMS